MKEYPTASCRTLGWELKGEAEPFTKVLDEYLEAFLATDGVCPGCDRKLAGKDMIDAFTSTFRWGLANGEGACCECGWPARAYHRNIGPIEFLNHVLPYRLSESGIQKIKDRQQEELANGP